MTAAWIWHCNGNIFPSSHYHDMRRSRCLACLLALLTEFSLQWQLMLPQTVVFPGVSCEGSRRMR